MSTFVRAHDVLWRMTMDGILILSRNSDEAMHIVGSTSELWDLLAQPHTAEELVTQLATIYQMRYDDVHSHVARVVDDLVQADPVLEVA